MGVLWLFSLALDQLLEDFSQTEEERTEGPRVKRTANRTGRLKSTADVGRLRSTAAAQSYYYCKYAG